MYFPILYVDYTAVVKYYLQIRKYFYKFALRIVNNQIKTDKKDETYISTF